MNPKPAPAVPTEQRPDRDARITVLVTGATGLIGHATCAALVAKGYRVLGATRGAEALPEGCEPVWFDVRDAAGVLESVARCHVVLHLAAIVGNAPCEADLQSAIEVNVGGTLNVLEAIVAHRKPMIFASVANVEDNTPYAITKATAERFCLMFNRERGTRVLPVRIFNAYGPGQKSSSGKLVAASLEKALRGEELQCHGDGMQVEDFVYLDDVGQALAACVASILADPPVSLAPRTIGTGIGTTILEVLHTIRRLTKSESPIVVRGARAGRNTRSLVAANERILLDHEYVSLEEGLARTIAHFSPDGRMGTSEDRRSEGPRRDSPL